LSNLGIRLAELGRYKEALTATEESVGLRRPLARDNPAYQPDLADGLNNLGNRLAELGRRQEALAAAEEAVVLWRMLARNNPGRYQEIYSRKLIELRRDLSLNGQESASILLHLNDESPNHNKPDKFRPRPTCRNGELASACLLMVGWSGRHQPQRCGTGGRRALRPRFVHEVMLRLDCTPGTIR
jgi:tetratricopeptide (TPR) repeat protein